jgi:hypothetical protein
MSFAMITSLFDNRSRGETVSIKKTKVQDRAGVVGIGFGVDFFWLSLETGRHYPF